MEKTRRIAQETAIANTKKALEQAVDEAKREEALKQRAMFRRGPACTHNLSASRVYPMYLCGPAHIHTTTVDPRTPPTSTAPHIRTASKAYTVGPWSFQN